MIFPEFSFYKKQQVRLQLYKVFGDKLVETFYAVIIHIDVNLSVSVIFKTILLAMTLLLHSCDSQGRKAHILVLLRFSVLVLITVLKATIAWSY